MEAKPSYNVIECPYYDAVPKIIEALEAERARILSGAPDEFLIVEVQPSQVESNPPPFSNPSTAGVSTSEAILSHAKATSKKSKQKMDSKRRRSQRRVERATSATLNKPFAAKLRSSIAHRLNKPLVFPVSYDAVNMPIRSE